MMHIVILLLVYLIVCQFWMSCVAKCLRHSSGLIRFIASHGISFAAGVSVMGMNVTFCSARYNFKTCGSTSGVVNMNRVIQLYGEHTAQSSSLAATVAAVVATTTLIRANYA